MTQQQTKKRIDAEALARICAEAADEKKAENVVVINVGVATLVADYFVICGGTSGPHLRAISDWVIRKLRTGNSIRPLAVDGKSDTDWVVIDYGAVMVHILSPEARERYSLESLWGDAPRLPAAFVGRCPQKQ